MPSGQIDFSTGHSFVIDREHSNGVEFANHGVSTQPAGPKTRGAVPINDTPAGAIEVSAGDLQVGGFVDFFSDSDAAQFGRLRLRFS